LDLEGIVGKWVHGTYRTDGRNLVAENQKSRLYADPRTVTSCSTLRTVVTGALFGPTDPSLSIGSVRQGVCLTMMRE
jgi:hypothetical protein